MLLKYDIYSINFKFEESFNIKFFKNRKILKKKKNRNPNLKNKENS